MKFRFLLNSLGVLLMFFLTASCEKTILEKSSIASHRVNNPIGIDLILPILTEGSYLEVGDKLVIRNGSELQSFFSLSYLESDKLLNAVDLKYFDVLAAATQTHFFVDSLKHEFISIGENTWNYNVTAYHSGTAADDIFTYGVVVNKLPSAAVVNFNMILVKP